MHIFCRETQAHLDLNPHLVNASSSSNLITPELWLKNCRSRSASPTSDTSLSPKLEIVVSNKKTSNDKEVKSQNKKSPLPLISVAPPSKLMKQKGGSEDKIRKSPENKKDGRSKINLRKRRVSKCTSTITSQTHSRHNASTPKAQDLRICSPSTLDGSSPASTVMNSAIHSPTNPLNAHLPNVHPPPPPYTNTLYSNSMFMDNSIPPNHINDHRVPNMFPPHFMPRPHLPFPHDRPRLPPPITLPPQALGQPPPVTVMVPYPVILPIPLPIPIPLPVSTFAHAYNNKPRTEVNKTEDCEGPLDYTMKTITSKMLEENRTYDDHVNDEINNQAHENVEISDLVVEEQERENIESNNPEQTLPKFKITRVNNKLAKIVSKSRDPSESMRPLRKRRRIVEAPDEEDNFIPETRKIVEV